MGISADRAVTFASGLYCGIISDKSLTAQCGILDLLEPGDAVRADKGFLIEDQLRTKHGSFIIPPFLVTKVQFSEEEIDKTHEIAPYAFMMRRQSEE